ncbi:MAG: hypothetical protein FD138_2894, partial [Planctomycetota bacterium]
MAAKLPSAQAHEPGSAGSSVLKQLRSAFESQLITDGGSSIETWLEMVPAAEQAALFAELLDAELSFHQQCGHEVHPEDYVTRFPHLK